MKLQRVFGGIVLILAVVCCSGARGGAIDVAAAPPRQFDSVVIDAGHGGDDRGARGVGGLLEKDLVLDVAKRLAKRLKARGVRVSMTRVDDQFVPLERRTMIANDSGADLFVSIHANSSRSSKPRGVEAYFASVDASDASARELAERENSAFGADAAEPIEADPLVAIIGDMIAADTMRDSSAFARLAQAELEAIDRVPSRGVKQAPFVVLLGVQMPASLVEIGFLSNSSEAKALGRSDRRDAIAKALERAVIAYGERYDRLRGVGRTAK
jgi:N-acetylmuramoyl-L-alanine amidase